MKSWQAQVALYAWHQTVVKYVGKHLVTNRTCLYSRQLFRVGRLVSDVWACVVITFKQSKHVLYLLDLLTWHLQNGGRKWTFRFILEVYNCSAVLDVSSMAYKDNLKKKQEKMEELEEKVSFVQTFQYLRRFLFLLFFSSFSLFYICECHCTK